MPSVSALIKTSPFSSDTPSIAGGGGGRMRVCLWGVGFPVLSPFTHTALQTLTHYSDDWSEIPISQGGEVD